MSKMNPAEEITAIYSKYDMHVATTSHLARLAKDAEKGDAQKLEHARWLNVVLDDSRCGFTPEDIVRVKDLLAEIYEDIGSRGNAVAMRYAACTIANGAGHHTIHKTETGWGISVKPDFERAAEWARKSEALGDEVAAKIRPRLEEDARRAKRPKP